MWWLSSSEGKTVDTPDLDGETGCACAIERALMGDANRAVWPAGEIGSDRAGIPIHTSRRKIKFRLKLRPWPRGDRLRTMEESVSGNPEIGANGLAGPAVVRGQGDSGDLSVIEAVFCGPAWQGRTQRDEVNRR